MYLSLVVKFSNYVQSSRAIVCRNELQWRIECAYSSHCKGVETWRGNLIERSKPRCVQFASINVSSLALWEHRGFKTEPAKGKDECPGRTKGRMEEEEEREAGGDAISLERQVTSRPSEWRLDMERPYLLFLIHPFQGSPLPTSASTTLDIPLFSPSRRSSLIGMEARANTYNIHQHLRRDRGGRESCRSRHPPSSLSGLSPPSISRLPSDRSMLWAATTPGRPPSSPQTDGWTRTDPRKSADGFAGPNIDCFQRTIVRTRSCSRIKLYCSNWLRANASLSKQTCYL